MNIIFGQSALDSVDEKYVVLELDTIRISGTNDPLTAYCVLDQLPITEIVTLDQYRSLHANLMKNYRLKNWKFCRDAISHLHGQWNKQVDSFYENLLTRLDEFESNDPGSDWDAIVDRR